jgi:putative oxidoreductase
MTLEAVRSRTLAALDRLSWVGPLALRLSLGAVFLGTGWGKLHNLGQVTSFFTELGVPFPGFNATLVAGVELVCGTLILLGALTRFAVLPLMAVMAVAILTAKRPEIDGIRSLLAFDETTYLAGFLWLFVAGAGKASIDALIFRRKPSAASVRSRIDPNEMAAEHR